MGIEINHSSLSKGFGSIEKLRAHIPLFLALHEPPSPIPNSNQPDFHNTFHVTITAPSCKVLHYLLSNPGVWQQDGAS